MRPLRTAIPAAEVSQMQREARAWDAYLSALEARDPKAHDLFRVYACIHGERPGSMAERLERARGLR